MLSKNRGTEDWQAKKKGMKLQNYSPEKAGGHGDKCRKDGKRHFLDVLAGPAA